MRIDVHEKSGTFHLHNDELSYVMKVLPNGHLGQLYFGAPIHDREDFDYLLEICARSHAAVFEDEGFVSLEHVKQEYPSYGNSDFREGAVEILQPDGSRLSDFRYAGYRIEHGKPRLPGLPATYTEDDAEAETLAVTLRDGKDGMEATLFYTIFAGAGVIARSARLENRGTEPVHIERAMSLSLDLPDASYDWIQLAGSWARERTPLRQPLHSGIQAVESLRGHSSHQYNPFLMLVRPETGEDSGEAMGFCLVYSGNFLAQIQADTYGVTRVTMGIHPAWFSWKLAPGESFQTPEAVIVYTNHGLNAMSQTFHRLFRDRLARGAWKNRVRPILINNWEATYFDFDEPKLLSIAEKAKEEGVELFVLDDGWFGARRNDRAGLGDWVPAEGLLPSGIAGLSKKITAMGLSFGLWFEPEMVNPDSDLYRAHPDWTLHAPGRKPTTSRHQLVLDFSRPEVVDYVHGLIAAILREADISYVKWDMNRSITECYSIALPADRQGEVFHRYILGVYDLYERLTSEFPEILFESCAGGGGRFDAGLLYYAPQGWTSDDTDAIERIRIQYGTSYAYPVSSMGSHVSAVPNHQLRRVTSLKTRADVAYFGTYGYELDLNRLSEEEQEQVKACTRFMKEHRELIQYGTFYRLRSPFESNEAAWMVVSGDRKEAIVAYYQILSTVNGGFLRLPLRGLDPDRFYHVREDAGAEGDFYGDELMRAGLVTSDETSQKIGERIRPAGDFRSTLYLLRAKD